MGPVLLYALVTLRRCAARLEHGGDPLTLVFSQRREVGDDLGDVPGEFRECEFAPCLDEHGVIGCAIAVSAA